jgi:hypothetical protein
LGSLLLLALLLARELSGQTPSIEAHRASGLRCGRGHNQFASTLIWRLRKSDLTESTDAAEMYPLIA